MADSFTIKELEIYYLFLSADGRMTPEESKNLDLIIEKENVSGETKKEFADYCNQIELQLTSMSLDKIIKEIDEIIDGKNGSDLESMLRAVRARLANIHLSKTRCAQIIWTLINLGYSDGDYSKAERQIVNHLVQRWSVDGDLFIELSDTAESILLLSKQKEHLLSKQVLSSAEREYIQELDESIASLFFNVELSISEAGIEDEKEDS